MSVELMERLAAQDSYDRAAEDVGNIIELAHVNIWVRDPHVGHLFYVVGLGLTRDPFGVTGISSMWINIGRSQFHLPWGDAPRIQAVTALIMADLNVLKKNLGSISKPLEGTAFAFSDQGDHVAVTCPWGNRFRCYAPNPERFGPMLLGVPYVQFYAKPNSLQRIVRFYREVIGTYADLGTDAEGPFAWVNAGPGQKIIYRETDTYQREFWGHHIQITLADFSSPYKKLKALGLITEETNQHQYRFEDVVDIDTGEVLFTTQHETRSMHHPHFNRHLINRASWMDNTNLVQGHEYQPLVALHRYARTGSR